MKYNPRVAIAFFKEHGIPEPVTEHKFCETRRWKMDFAWFENWHNFPVCLEVQGGIFIQGRHSRGAAMLKEWEKLNEAAALGWRVLYCQPKDLCTLETVTLIKRALGIHPVHNPRPD